MYKYVADAISRRGNHFLLKFKVSLITFNAKFACFVAPIVMIH